MKWILIGIFLLLTGCRLDGTHTGNPGEAVHSGNEKDISYDPNEPQNGAPLIAPVHGGARSPDRLVCSMVVFCNPQEKLDTCYSAVAKNGSIVSALGYDSDVYPTYQQLIDENASINESQFKECEQAVLGLACDSDTMQDAYMGESTNVFSNIHYLLQATTSCSKIGEEINAE